MIYLEAGALILFALYLLACTVEFFHGLFVSSYRVFRYERKGICADCKKPFRATIATPVSQQYGPSVIYTPVCECGGVGLPRGNRHWTEW